MSTAWSLTARRPFGLQRVCRVWEIARSSVYDALQRRTRETAQPRIGAEPPPKRGPKSALPDAALVARIRDELAASPFVGEGYRKVWARLRVAGTRTSKARVLRLMRDRGLLAPTRAGQPHGPKAHDGTIIPSGPNLMWGTDATSCHTDEGTATVFIAVDHFVAACVGIHAARPGNRFAAFEPIRQGLRAVYGGAARPDVARGLALRHDHGSQYMSDWFQTELRFVGIESSPAFVREPEGNGCAERFIRTLKEQLLWVRRFATVEELRVALIAFKEQYNARWLIERHGHRPPDAVRQREALAAAA
jgi:putative transposase